MLSKKFYLPIGILLVVICAVSLLSLRSDVPDEPIVIYKTTTPAETPAETPAKATTAEVKETSTTDTAAGGHFHADGTFHADPHTETEKKGDGYRSDEAHQPPINASYSEKSDLVKKKEAYIKELEAKIASNKEMAVIRTWYDTNLDPLITELRPFFAEASTGDLAAAEAFWESHYPTTEAKLDAAHKLLDLTDLCREFLSRIDASSELSRSRFYEELESGNGWLFGLQDPVYIPTLKQFIAYYEGKE